MNKYPSYKHSGVKWLGAIPADWSVTKLKYIGTTLIGITYSPENVVAEGEGTLVLRSSNIQKGVFDNKDCVYVNLKIPTELCTRIGDILLCARNGSATLVGKNICIDSSLTAVTFGAFMTIFRTKHWKYLSYFFNSEIFNAQTGLFATSTINQLTNDTLRSMKIAIPLHANEQQAIVNFLSYKTAQIDKFIADRTRQIELFQEQKAAIINKAVTKGTNPNVKMKPSGIEWLPEVPEHWNVWKMKFLTSKIGSGVTPLGGSQVYKTEGVAFFRSQNIYNDRFELENISFIENSIHLEMNNTKVKKGDVLLNITGASIGRCYYFSGEFPEANVNQHVCIIRANSKINFSFLHSVMVSEIGQCQVFSKQSGTNREGLNFEQLKNFYVSLPPQNEQQEIMDFLKIEASKIDEVTAKFKKQIGLMQEYRTSLISQAVTGKIDVRDWQPKSAGVAAL